VLAVSHVTPVTQFVSPAVQVVELSLSMYTKILLRPYKMSGVTVPGIVHVTSMAVFSTTLLEDGVIAETLTGQATSP
jgi:hypothetical protein